MQKIIIYDCDAVCWAVHHAMPQLSHGESQTAIIYGFLKHLMYFTEYQYFDNILFAWDSKTSLRSKLFPGYKQKRKEKYSSMTEEEKRLHKSRRNQFDAIREDVLPALGFSNILYAEGFEGDDMIASAVHNACADHNVLIVGRDNDLFQLIRPYCMIYDWIKKEIISIDDIVSKYKIHPSRWAEVKSIAGCNTDEVPGVIGVGEKKAIQYLSDELKPTSVAATKIRQSKDVIELTRRLVQLPFEGTPVIDKIHQNTSTIDKFLAVVNDYGFNSLRSNQFVRNFERTFCAKKNHNPA